MSWIVEATIAVCVVIATGGTTFYLVMSRMMRKLPDADGSRLNGIEQRVAALERRMTDVQDVLISLDEKHRDQIPVNSEAKEG